MTIPATDKKLRFTLKLPGNLNVALSTFVDEAGGGRLAAASAALSSRYRGGANSSAVDLAAYVAARVPATFAANQRVLADMAEVWPDFAPHSAVDVGAGPGVAGWAALAQWPGLQVLTQLEQDVRFAGLAQRFNAASGLMTLQQASVLQQPLQALNVGADVVLASYVLAELPLAVATQAADTLWAATGQALVLIEPGTPQGFERLRLIRSHLLARGAFGIAPCTHAASCPMAGDDWCHFKVRLARSRAHMHAKGAVVPFEDEAFSYLVLARAPVPLRGERILTPPVVGKAGVEMALCGNQGLATETIARRDKASYKRAKHSRWGDLWI